MMQRSHWLLLTLCLHSSEPPPTITVEGNVTVSPGSRAVFTCHVVSTVNYNLTWLRGGHDARLDPRVQVLTNLSLQVSSVSPDQSGWYECVAINEGGVTAERIYLTVQGEECVFILTYTVEYRESCVLICVCLYCALDKLFPRYMGLRPPQLPLIHIHGLR